ncbi:MAG: hypothetical protein DRN20_03020 [Thermoplasmata archaeon]|nr:MAG: hypothetical protein DRN20_03020 [Thermoplasmata archaeon]
MRFLVDRMLGTLVKWLRILGYDTLYAPEGDDEKVLVIAKKENRILLTRDKDMEARAKKLGISSLYISSDSLNEQISAVAKKFGINAENALSRCAVCNVEIEVVEKEGVRGKVPEAVYMLKKEFWVCRNCGRVYWVGTHWDGIKKRLNGIFFQS